MSAAQNCPSGVGGRGICTGESGQWPSVNTIAYFKDATCLSLPGTIPQGVHTKETDKAIGGRMGLSHPQPGAGHQSLVVSRALMSLGGSVSGKMKIEMEMGEWMGCARAWITARRHPNPVDACLARKHGPSFQPDLEKCGVLLDPCETVPNAPVLNLKPEAALPR